MSASVAKLPSVTEFIDWYGSGDPAECPTAEQWARLLDRPVAEPLTLINFFRFRERAEYQQAPETEPARSGAEAFECYAAVSIPTMERVGGHFLHVGPFVGTFIGADEHWDLIAIGAYPNLEAFSALYSDPGYRAAFAHRSAACARQKVLVCA